MRRQIWMLKGHLEHGYDLEKLRLVVDKYEALNLELTHYDHASLHSTSH